MTSALHTHSIHDIITAVEKTSSKGHGLFASSASMRQRARYLTSESQALLSILHFRGEMNMADKVEYEDLYSDVQDTLSQKDAKRHLDAAEALWSFTLRQVRATSHALITGVGSSLYASTDSQPSTFATSQVYPQTSIPPQPQPQPQVQLQAQPQPQSWLSPHLQPPVQQQSQPDTQPQTEHRTVRHAIAISPPRRASSLPPPPPRYPLHRHAPMPRGILKKPKTWTPQGLLPSMYAAPTMPVPQIWQPVPGPAAAPTQGPMQMPTPVQIPVFAIAIPAGLGPPQYPQQTWAPAMPSWYTI